jgi:esterase/lipase superfamily enzyme
MKKISLILFVLIWNCQTPEKFVLKDELSKRILVPYDTTSTVRVLFGTLRRITSENVNCSNSTYSTQLDVNEKYGFCDVSVPADHDIGSLDQDSSGNKDKFFKLESHTKLQNMESLLSKVKENNFDEVIVFVHGFNVKFEEAILRAAQIKYDLKFSGDIILYTWPAGADEGILSPLLIKTTYLNNQNNARNSINSFKNFLKSINSLGKKTHLIVHSMGHQIVIPSISDLQKELNKKIFSQTIFNAPDFDLEEFKKLSRSVIDSSERVTVYCSPGDNALVASKAVNSNKRLGSCEKISGIDTINVNPVDAPVLGVAGLGHGYYSSRPILTDLYQTILGLDASKRLFIRKSSPYNGEDYVMRR